MKISNIGPGALDIYKMQQEKNQEAKPERSVQERDRAEISPRGVELQRYRGIMATMPDVRAAKVQQLKASIANGTYKPDAERIAEKLLQERRLDILV